MIKKCKRIVYHRSGPGLIQGFLSGYSGLCTQSKVSCEDCYVLKLNQLTDVNQM